MSDNSVKSCGPINCQLETAKQYLKLRKVISFCGLPTCNEDLHRETSCKSPFELKQLLEYCRPSNCVEFWDARSECLSKRSSNPSLGATRTSDPSPSHTSILINDIGSASQIFNSPECEIPNCPKKLNKESEKHKRTDGHGSQIQINICGPPHCCSSIDVVSTVDFNFACDLESKQCKNLTENNNILTFRNNRNAIYYCVSPSVYKDFELACNYEEVHRYAKAETVISAHLMKKNLVQPVHCQTNSKKKLTSESTTPMQRKTTFPEDLIEDISETADIASSFHTFRSNTTLNSSRPVFKPDVKTIFPAPKQLNVIESDSSHLRYRMRSLTTSQDFPQTPSPSSTIVDLKNISSPFQGFPLRPKGITSKEENIVKSYLSGNDHFSVAASDVAQEPVQITRRNPSEVNALLKTVYSISSGDFPPTPAKDASQGSGFKLNQTNLAVGLNKLDNREAKHNGSLSNKNEIISGTLSAKSEGSSEEEYAAGKRPTNENSLRKSVESLDPAKRKCRDTERNSSCSPCSGREAKTKQTVPSHPTCFPSSCDKLLGLKKWKACCNSPLCPINDPTSSTYNFLLKVRMCCGKRKCQLAAKICDIYEPLVQIEPDLSEVGDAQYHYLATDAATDAPEVKPVESPTTSSDVITVYEVPQVPSVQQPPEEADQSQHELVPLKHASSIAESAVGSSDTINEQPNKGTSRRTSTVSWSVPQEDSGGPSTSQEQIISRATAEADKFRQTPVVLRHASVFGEIVRKSVDDPTELEEDTQKEGKFKSQLSNIQKNDSGHKQKCCSALKEKFKRKKKKKRLGDTNESSMSWRTSTDVHEKRKTNISAIPVQEKSQQISNMLNKMY